MKCKKYFLILFITTIFAYTSIAEACRFWVASTKNVPSDIVKEHLLNLPQSLKFLGDEYRDGWSVSVYKGTTALIARSEKSSTHDDGYDKAVNYAAGTNANIVIGHLRRASSGCVEGIPNPHPFQRFHNGKNWLFGHNGGIDKQLLISLIGQEYLDNNSPQSCNDNPPDSWVDSELYFVYLLKKIDEADTNVKKGLESAINELYGHINDDKQYLNFFLADGKDIWAFRKGTDLFYTYDRKKRLSIVSSTVPGEDQFEWKEFPEDNLVRIRPRKKPRFYSLKK